MTIRAYVIFFIIDERLHMNKSILHMYMLLYRISRSVATHTETDLTVSHAIKCRSHRLKSLSATDCKDPRLKATRLG